MSLGRRGLLLLHPHTHIQLSSIVSRQQPPPTWIDVRSLSSTAASTSFFDAPEPPKSHGTPVFPDIEFENKRDDNHASILRNYDAQAVFIVNGSSRGIGLQFVKSLLKRTKV
jgi:hypothetical protein